MFWLHAEQPLGHTLSGATTQHALYVPSLRRDSALSRGADELVVAELAGTR